jgi:hypothetical protein
VDKAATSLSRAPSTPKHSEFDCTITIDGIHEETNENLPQLCEDLAFEHMGLNYTKYHMEQCVRIGREIVHPEGEGPSKVRPRTIQIRFHQPERKAAILKYRYKLRGKHVFVNDYYSEAIEKACRRIYPIVRKARGLPEYEDRISQHEDKLIYDGVELTVDDFDKLPDNIHPRNICTETRGDVTFFFKMDSPLSNHHPCEFELDNINFNCSEQAYFYLKAVECKDDSAKRRIMKTSNPGIQKSIGGQIKDTPDWTTNKVAAMKRVCMAKFSQNKKLRDFLLDTKSNYLAEDNPNDGFWGIKLRRNSPRSKSRANFKANNLGVLLMEIRDTLS